MGRLLAPVAPYLLAAALLAVGGGVWWIMDLRATAAALRAENASLAREIAVQAELADQRALARDVARAEAERLRKKAAEYDNLREWIIANDDQAPLPPLLRDTLDRLLARPGR